MVWVMLFAFFTATDVHIEYGPTFSTEEECLKAQDFHDNGGTSFRTLCVPMEGE